MATQRAIHEHIPPLRTPRRRALHHYAVVLGTLAILATGLTTVERVAAVGPFGESITAELPTDDPANWTPNVLNGKVNAIWQVGDKVIIGGSFTQVADAVGNGGAIYSRSNIAAFDATTGLVDPAFAPVLSGPVEAVIPAADGTSIYVGGNFNTVNGTNRRKVARLNLADGTLITSFNAGGVNGTVRDLRLVGNTIYMGGLFTTVGVQSRSYLASLDANSGAVTSKLNVALTGLWNGGTGKVMKLEVTPDGDRLMIIGNFTSMDGLARAQVGLIDLTTTPATVSPWDTTFFTSTCSASFDTYMRDLDVSEDGTFAVITTTGAYKANSSCDTVSRFELTNEQAGQTPTWVNMTGGDTSYAVEIHHGVAYVGGHMRWFNNPFSADRHGAGGVYRSGMGAVDVATGLPFSWDPGRTRGVGLFDYFVTEQGIWAGSDTDRFNDELRARLAFFPWATGSLVPANDVGDLPNDVFQLGRTAGTTGTVDASVLYRINAGGPLLASVDDGPDWIADTAGTSIYRTSGSNAATAPSSLATPFNDSTVPTGDMDRPPAQLWTTERNDPAGGNTMQWSFPVAAGTPIRVRLYFADRNYSTDDLGERIFGVNLDGVTVLPSFDLSGTVGHNFGTMRSFDVVSDGTVNIDFANAVNNPLVNGIEIIALGVTTTDTLGTQDEVTHHYFDGATVTGTTISAGTVPWRTVRGAFMVNSTLYTIHLDGTIVKRTVDDNVFGPGTTVPMWSNNILADAPTMTGMFFDPDTSRIYYTMSGQNSLFYRPFLPESNIVHATRYTAGGDVAALVPSRVRGMFLGNGRLWFGDATTGNLLSMPFTNGQPSGTPEIAESTVDWRSRALFRSSGAQPNVLPTAVYTHECSANSCDFDASTSSDTDGTILTYDWDFGDGNTGTGATIEHDYAGAGIYTVTLTVTDDRSGATDFSSDVTVSDPPNIAPTAAITANCTLLSCTLDGSSSSDVDGTVASYDWEFGDDTAGSGATAIHEYASEGIFEVELTVTDNDGDTATAQATVEAIAPSSAALFRAAASANSQGSTAPIVVPANVEAGDQLVYVVTANTATTATTPAGWTLLASQQDGNPDMTSWVFTRTADAATAGSSVSVGLGGSAKTARTLVAYDNAAPPTGATATVIGASSASLTTASADITYTGSAVVSYWSDKSASNADWETPVSVDLRALSVGSGSGRITAAIGDSVVPAGTWPDTTATSDVAGTKGIGWTVVLPPGTGNLLPTATFTSLCSSLLCSFDGTGSSDPDGTIVAYAWDFGDGATATVADPSHTYNADGSYTVTLTVTDDKGGEATTSFGVDVTLAVVGFRAANSTNQNSNLASVQVPSQVQPGDQLLLFITTNAATSVTTPTGWTLLGSQTAGTPDMVSLAFTRTAVTGTGGSTVAASLGLTAKSSSIVLAYTGASPITTAGVSVSPSTSTDLTTPAVPVASSGSVVVSYWVDKTSGNTGWTLPGNVVGRSASIGSGGGRITAAAGDTVAPAGSWPGATASGTVSGSKAIGWSVVVPAP